MTTLFCILLWMLISQCEAQEIFSTSWEAEVTKGRASASCRFQLSYSDHGVQAANVTCTDVTKAMAAVNHEHNAKTMHKIRLTLKIMKNGLTRVTSSSVDRGWRIIDFYRKEECLHFSESCLLGYSYVCNSSYSSDDRTAMCPMQQEKT